MAVRRLYVVISVIVVFAFLFASFIFVISPPNASSEVLIKSGFTNWSVENEPVVHGETIWSTFADYDRDQTIKLGYEAYLGGLNLNTEYMSWEGQDGSYSTNSLTFDDLMNRWQDSESVFKFKHEETFFRVSFSIPQQENGAPKYHSLEEAWANKELYQTIEIW